MNWIRTDNKMITIFEGVDFGPKDSSSHIFDQELMGKCKHQAKKILNIRFGYVNKIGNKFFCKEPKSVK